MFLIPRGSRVVENLLYKIKPRIWTNASKDADGRKRFHTSPFDKRASWGGRMPPHEV